MKILVITTTYPPSLNGVAISTHRTVEELRRQGHTVTVVMPRHPQRHKKHSDDIEIPSVTNPIQKDYPVPLPFFRKITQLLKRNSYDIVHFHQPVLIEGFAKKIAKIHNIPLVFTYHTRYEEYAQHYLPFLPKQLSRSIVGKHVARTIEQCQAIIATTQYYQKLLSRLYSTPVTYVSTAGLTRSMLVKKSKESLRKKHNLPVSKKVLLNVSRLVPEKNLDLLLRTVALLPSSYHLVMVGGGISAPSLKNLSIELGIQDQVTFTGPIPQENLDEYCTLADFFVYSSKTDTIGINILEAMSAGLPVFAVKDPNVEEVVKDGLNGRVLPPTPTAFAKAIRLFPTVRYAAFSKNARKTANEFMMTHTAKQLIKTYKSLVQQSHV